MTTPKEPEGAEPMVRRLIGWAAYGLAWTIVALLFLPMILAAALFDVTEWSAKQ